MFLFCFVFRCQALLAKLTAIELRQDSSAALAGDLQRHVRQSLEGYDSANAFFCFVLVCLFDCMFI